jgi:hypothetical protein
LAENLSPRALEILDPAANPIPGLAENDPVPPTSVKCPAANSNPGWPKIPKAPREWPQYPLPSRPGLAENYRIKELAEACIIANPIVGLAENRAIRASARARRAANPITGLVENYRRSDALEKRPVANPILGLAENIGMTSPEFD